jgi:hypothetical protein
VLVLVLDVVVLVQDVGMRMRRIPVGVLMNVLCGHCPCSVPDGIYLARSPTVFPLIGLFSDATRFTRTVGKRFPSRD